MSREEITKLLDSAIGMTVAAWQYIDTDSAFDDGPWPGEGIRICLTDGTSVRVLTLYERGQAGEVGYKMENVK